MRHLVTTPTFVLFVLASIGSQSCLGSTLYMTDTLSELRTVDPSTGASTLVGSAVPNLIFSGLTSRPGDNTFLYAVHNGVRVAGLVKIDRLTGASIALPDFSEATLGFPQPFATAVAISPRNPNVAVVAGFNSDRESPNRGEDFLWEVDVATGVVLGPAVRASALRALTYNLDGTVLFGALMTSANPADSAQLVTVDASTGATSQVGVPGLSRSVEGLAFRPEDGVLFAIDAEGIDNLVILDPSNGVLVSTVGNLGVRGPDGLAFFREIPEPSTLGLMAGAVAYLCSVSGRQRRC